jgi:cytochrome c biogenesis protein CcmG/thiol:disulfide interchange protein DsbE
MVLAPPLIFLGIAAMFLVGMYRDDPDALPLATLGQIAPDFELAALGARPSFGAEELRAPGVKLVNYWASWCGPCRVEHPNLMALSAEVIPIYGINYKDDPAKAERFLAELGDPYRAVAADASGRVALDWGLYGVPETYVIDGQGRLVLRHAGPLTNDVVENVIRPALEQAKSAPDQ